MNTCWTWRLHGQICISGRNRRRNKNESSDVYGQPGCGIGLCKLFSEVQSTQFAWLLIDIPIYDIWLISYLWLITSPCFWTFNVLVFEYRWGLTDLLYEYWTWIDLVKVYHFERWLFLSPSFRIFFRPKALNYLLVRVAHCVFCITMLLGTVGQRHMQL